MYLLPSRRLKRVVSALEMQLEDRWHCVLSKLAKVLRLSLFIAAMLFPPQSIGAEQGAVSLDIDQDGAVNPLSDGLLLLRALFGFEGASLVAGALGPNAENQDPESVLQEINALKPYIDVDQDGSVAALSDGLLILRSLFGFEGTALVSGAINLSQANRVDPALIRNYITQVKNGFRVALQFSGDVRGDTSEEFSVSGTLDVEHDLGPVLEPIYSILIAPEYGSVEIDRASGAWGYIPDENVNGNDVFGVSVIDDFGQPSFIEISITITQVDDAASFGGDVTGSTAEGVAVTGTITAADAIDGLTAPNFKIATDAVQGAATIDAATGVWTYTPADNYNGVDSFTVSVTDDDGNTAVQVVSLVITQVDDAASFGGDVTGSTAEGVAVTGTITAADAIDGLTAPNFKIATDAVQGAATIDAATGVWTYTPADNYNGVDSFTVSVTDDDGNTAVQVVSLVITQVDDAASFGGDVTGSTAEGVAVTGTITAADAIDGLTAPNFKIATDAVQGAATIDAATGVWTYTPADNYNGVDSFTVSVTDDDGNTAVQVVSLVITQVDDAASFGGDVTGSTAEGVAVTGTITAADAIDGLTAPNFKIATDAVQGAATIDAATGVWTYTPADNYNGVDSFTVSVTDDDGNTAVQVVSLVITQVDDAASFGGDVTGSTAEGVAVTGTITAADAIDGLTAPNFKIATDAVQGAATIDAATGVWTYTPADNYNGVDSFTVSVTDDDGNTAVQVVSLVITQVDDAASFGGDVTGSTAEGVAVTGTITAADAIDGLTAPNFKIATDAVQGAATIDAATGVWTYTPADNYNGVDSFTVSVTDDDGNTAVQVVSLVITQVDDAASFGGDVTGSTAEGVAVTGTITAADAIDGLTAPNFKIATDAVQGAATIDAATGVWTYTPADNYNGVDSFTVSVTDDDGNTAVQVVSLDDYPG